MSKQLGRVKIYPTGTTVTWYVRPGGSDSNRGDSSSSAFATIERAFEQLDHDVIGLRQIIDITGMKGADAITKASGSLEFPVIQSGFESPTGGPIVGPNNYWIETPVQLRSDMSLVQSLTVDSVSNDSVTGFATVNVTETLTADAHVGQMLLSDGFYEGGVIVSNTTNSLVITSTESSFTASGLGIYEYGAEINSDGPVKIPASCRWFISGIKFSDTSGDDYSLAVQGPYKTSLQQCDIEGISFQSGGEDFGSGFNVEKCYIHGSGRRFWLLNASTNGPVYRRCMLDTLDYSMDTHYASFVQCWFEAPQEPVGRNHGALETLEVSNFEIANAAGTAVSSADRVDLTNGRIRDSGGYGVSFSGKILQLNNIVGTGNANYGVSLSPRSRIDVSGSTSLTGASGDMTVSGLSSARSWSDVPFTALGTGVIVTDTTVDDFEIVSGGKIKTPAAVVPSVVALGNSGTISIDASASTFYELDLSGDGTLQNPTNLEKGMSFTIVVNSSGSGHTLSFDSNYDFGDGSAPDTSTMSDGDTLVLSCIALTSSQVACVSNGGFA